MSRDRFTDDRERDSRVVISDQDGVAEALAAMHDASDRAEQIYEALRTTGTLAKRRTLVYRCAKCRHSVLDVISVDDGIVIGFPRYKTSPDETERTSSAKGRVKNTEDGHRHWKSRASYRQYVSRPMLACDHMRIALEDADLDADLAAGHAEVIVRPDGSRYVP